MSLKTVLNQQAYLLFYIKDNTTTQKEVRIRICCYRDLRVFGDV